jgi:glucokinase
MSTVRQPVTRNQAHPPFFVGVDLGATSTKLGVVDDLGQTLSYRKIPTGADGDPKTAVQRIAEEVLDTIHVAQLQLPAVARIGLGAPGPMDIRQGLLVAPVNMPAWRNFPLRDQLSQHCALPVTFANDAAAAAFGEYWLGAGRNVHSLVLLTLGTGIGGGIIVEGKSIDGFHSHGAECGHIVIDYHDDARICGCGRPGHLEAYASGTAIVKRTIEALESGMKTSLNARMEHGAQLTPKLVADEAEAGDPLSLEIVLDTARYLAVGIVSLMHTIDPDSVLLGGAMDFGGADSPLGRRFLVTLRQEVRRRAFPIPAEQTTIEYAALGSDAGYLGAAGLARADHKQHGPQ